MFIYVYLAVSVCVCDRDTYTHTLCLQAPNLYVHPEPELWLDVLWNDSLSYDEEVHLYEGHRWFLEENLTCPVRGSHSLFHKTLMEAWFWE